MVGRCNEMLEIKEVRVFIERSEVSKSCPSKCVLSFKECGCLCLCLPTLSPAFWGQIYPPNSSYLPDISWYPDLQIVLEVHSYLSAFDNLIFNKKSIVLCCVRVAQNRDTCTLHETCLETLRLDGLDQGNPCTSESVYANRSMGVSASISGQSWNLIACLEPG